MVSLYSLFSSHRYSDKIHLLSRKATGRGPELRDILAALTTIKSNDAFDLERVETLGDSFLKFAATLYLFHKFPKLNEGQLTNIKSRLLGNKYFISVSISYPISLKKISSESMHNCAIVPDSFKKQSKSPKLIL